MYAVAYCNFLFRTFAQEKQIPQFPLPKDFFYCPVRPLVSLSPLSLLQQRWIGRLQSSLHLFNTNTNYLLFLLIVILIIFYFSYSSIFLFLLQYYFFS